MSENTAKNLGIVVSGSLTGGVEVKLDGTASVEDMAVGRYVTIQGEKRRFFGIITDVSLGFTDETMALNPPDAGHPFISQVLAGTCTYGKLKCALYLTLGIDAASLLEGPQPVKTIPSHYAAVNEATQNDVEVVFGKEDANKFFIGTPLDMETKVCLDLERFVQRSNGIFGKSGTGKTFLTRMLLVGMLQKGKAVNLIFDMHNEYGWEATSEDGRTVKGLKQLFESRVALFTLDDESARRRKAAVDFVVRIGYNEIEPEDIALLRQTLNLTEASVQAVYQLARRYGKNWIHAAMAIGESGNAEDTLTALNIHEATYQNLLRGLNSLRRLPFLVEESKDNPVDSILNFLDRGVNVVLEFGRFRDITAYILVANLLSRRIYNNYQTRSEKATGEKSQMPHPLVITIEEAHKFLNTEVANQTIFGTIAREMRKYNVTLLVIDQRPSGIDEEVMSQLGTKITCLLDSEKDIDSVLSGVSGKNELKSVLARLESRQQVLIFGHAVPMPVVVRTREYGSIESYSSLKPAEDNNENFEELWK